MSDEINKLKNKIFELEKKINYYEQLFKRNNIEYEENIMNSETNVTLSTQDKIDVYMHYFKGRKDCYAIRWEKDDKSGYAPSYSKEARFLNKEQRKKIEVSNRYEPLTKDIVFKHLKGSETIGIYPMLDDQTCYFLSFDFDEENFKKDVVKFSKICHAYHIDHLIEISRSGKGAHLWIFFETAVLAKDARKLGRFLLTETMMVHGLKSFKSYDRMFPSQDFIEKDGIGNLIALPLQGKSGIDGKTLFVDEDLKPYLNQYQTLKDTKKIKHEDFEVLLSKITKDNEIGSFNETIKQTAFDIADFPSKLDIIVKNQIYIKKQGLSLKGIQLLKRMASIINPEFYKKQNMRVSTYGISRIIELYEETESDIIIPIGLLGRLEHTLNEQHIIYEVSDLRTQSKIKRKISFSGTLRDEQQVALAGVIKNPNGVIIAPTGFGKTVLGIAAFAKLKMKTLVIVNRVAIAEQWIDKIRTFTETVFIGKLYDKYYELNQDIDIATIQSLSSYEKIDEIVNNYGLIIIDEAHHVASFSYERLLRQFNAKYIIGLTATLKRSDGLENIITAMIGPVIMEVSSDSKNLKRLLTTRLTGFKISGIDELSITDAYQKLYENKERNEMILTDIKNAHDMKKNVLVLTDRMSHIHILEKAIKSFTNQLLIVHGKLKAKEKSIFNESLKSKKEPFIILATGKYIGEGFDDDRLDTLFLTMPFRWRGTLQQYVGRLNRTRQDKHEIQVYDYADIGVKYFSNMYLDRLKGYRQMGYEISTSKAFESSIYYLENYQKELKEDLKKAKTITFIARYSNEDRLKDLLNDCNEPPTLLTGKEYASNIIIVDKKIVWYGSINPFIYKQQSDSDIMRYQDVLLAEELLNYSK